MVHSQSELAISGVRMIVVGEYLSEKDEGVPFTAPINKIFKSMLRQQGISPDDCLFLTVLKSATLNQAITRDRSKSRKGVRPIRAGKYLREEYFSEVDELRETIRRLKPNLVLTLGEIGLWAVTSEKSIENSRGRITNGMSTFPEQKVLPTYSPSQMMANYSLRPILLADLGKAQREQMFPEIRRPRRFIHIKPSLTDIEDFTREYMPEGIDASVDIETKGTMITCIGFAPNKERCLVIPFYDEERPSGNYWDTHKEEVIAWNLVSKLLAEYRTFGQNFQYDMQYLIREMGIPCRKFCDDTMIMHHSLQLEMKKGLGFLASIYTDELPWKFMHKLGDKSAKRGND